MRRAKKRRWGPPPHDCPEGTCDLSPPPKKISKQINLDFPPWISKYNEICREVWEGGSLKRGRRSLTARETNRIRFGVSSPRPASSVPATRSPLRETRTQQLEETVLLRRLELGLRGWGPGRGRRAANLQIGLGSVGVRGTGGLGDPGRGAGIAERRDGVAVPTAAAQLLSITGRELAFGREHRLPGKRDLVS